MGSRCRQGGPWGWWGSACPQLHAPRPTEQRKTIGKAIPSEQQRRGEVGWPRSHPLPQPPRSWRPAVSTLGRTPSPAAAVPARKGLAHPGGVGWGGGWPPTKGRSYGCSAARAGGGQQGRNEGAGQGEQGDPSPEATALFLQQKVWRAFHHGRRGVRPETGAEGRGRVWSHWLPCGKDPQGGPRARLDGKEAVARSQGQQR